MKPRIEDLAIAHFEASERLRYLMMMNMPTDYEARRQAAIDLAKAQADAAAAKRQLDEAINNPD